MGFWCRGATRMLAGRVDGCVGLSRFGELELKGIRGAGGSVQRGVGAVGG